MSHRLPLLLRAGSGRLTLLRGELRQLRLLQRIKDERTGGDLDTQHTNATNTDVGRNRHGGENKGVVGERTGKGTRKMHGTRAEGK